MTGRNQWVFGYGSLMWKPGFPALRAVPATLHGYHRALCVYSHKYRGTIDVPGLVFGLDRGGSCSGIAFEVENSQWPDTLAYLRERELVTAVYLETTLRVSLRDKTAKVEAVTYVADRNHAQYAGKLPADRLLAIVAKAHGETGSCLDYVNNTLCHLRELGLQDRALERLSRYL